jgi:ABC-type antimicrobial peptide transport system permease subunit
MLHQNYGFDIDRLVTFEISFPAERFDGDASRYIAAEQIRSSALNIPGIENVTLSWGAKYFSNVQSDRPSTAPVNLSINGYYVSPGFLEAYGIRLIEGRDFEPSDPADAVIISQSMARALWATASPVGHTMTFVKDRTFRVIGVASEVRNPMADPRDDAPEMYEPLLRPGSVPRAAPVLPSRSVLLTVRCGRPCPSLDLVRARLKSETAGLLVWPGKRIRDQYANQLERPRAGAVIALAFAGIALLAVGGGLFAVLTRVALQRQREFGIRLALGATPTDLGRIVHRSGLAIATVGMAAGAALAWALSRVIASVQYQVRVSDPLTWTVVLVAIAVTALAASWRPARQAMRVDPVVLLREE